MFKTSDRASFLIICFRLLQYYVFVYFLVMFLPFSPGTFIATPSPEKKNSMPNLPCTQRPFGNYWASAMFSGPDFIANLSDNLKIINPIFITCDDICKLLFVTS